MGSEAHHPICNFFRGYGCTGVRVYGCTWVRVRKLDRSTEYINYQPSPEYSCTDFNTKVLSVRPLVRWSVGPSVGQKLSRIYTYALPQYWIIQRYCCPPMQLCCGFLDNRRHLYRWWCWLVGWSLKLLWKITKWGFVIIFMWIMDSTGLSLYLDNRGVPITSCVSRFV